VATLPPNGKKETGLNNYTMFRKINYLVPIGLLLILIGFGSFYTYWNSASPSKTCASCHEIGSSVQILSTSSHRNLMCKECHGTALSNGFHSLKEKGMMVVHHVKNESVDDIKLQEGQLLEVMNNCVHCHASEQAKWLSGGHSASYRDIFLNQKHNTTEQLNFDCLRCHGMFSGSDIYGLVEPIDKKGPWKFKNSLIATNPAIPCFACHQIHVKGRPYQKPDFSNPGNFFYQRKDSRSKISFYNRHDKSYVGAENLPKIKLWNEDNALRISDDLTMRICVQCHAPGAHHRAGTSDDRTPLGVHEGLSCLACHEAHSNDARRSCIQCHPAISNCKLDVTTMNTSFADEKSPNNIHTVKCTDCHKEGNRQIKIARGKAAR
jgi:hypothetical protein